MLGLFQRCHARVFSGMTPPQWQRTGLPGAGAIVDQDAWLMAGLDYTRDVMNRLEVDLWNEAAKRTEKTTKRGDE